MNTPKSVLDSCMKEIYDNKLDLTKIVTLLESRWKESFPVIQVAPTQIKTQAVAAPAPKAIVFDDLWGEDLGSGLGDELGVASPENSETVVVVGDKKSVPAHVADGLSMGQLERMGFTGGGLVITLLLPALTRGKIVLKVGDAVFYKGVQFSILQCKEVVNWEQVKGNLYFVANCGS